MGNFKDCSFYYKGYKVLMEFDYFSDVIKAWHFVYKDDKRIIAPISPYELDPSIVKLWIDAGMPNSHYNWSKKTLEKYMKENDHEA